MDPNQQLTKQSNNGLSLITSEVDRKAVENLLPSERKIIESALQPKINIQPAVDVITVFIGLITAAYTRAGYKMPDASTLALYAEEFYGEIMDRFPRVTIPEVKEAMKAGVYGEAGEFTGLNPKTFMQFLKHYLNTDERKGAVQQFESRRLYLNAQTTLSPEQKESFNRNYVNEQYDLYLSGKLVVDFVPVDLYEFLYNERHMLLNSEEKKKINERAKAYHSRLKTSKRMKGNARSIGDALTDYLNTGDKEQTLINLSKRFAVWDFFEAKKNQGKKIIFETPKLLR